MKTFITGATGFIGTHLVERMAQTEHEMNCLVRKTSQVDQLREVGVTLITGDVTDKSSMLAGMRGCDAVINLANVYSFWEPHKEIYAKVNVEGTRNVMECALEAGISKVLHISSMVIYGKPADCPFTEESPVGPERFSDYARTKYEGDLIAWELYRTKGLPLVVIYPGAVLGPGDPKSTGQYIRALLQRRMPATICSDTIFTWVHVRDVAEVILRALEQEDNIGEKYLAGKYQLTVQEINQMVSQISGVPLPRMRMPNGLATVTAALLTGLADLTKKPPMWNMSRDQVSMMKAGFIGDGSKAGRVLGITYTPIGVAIEETIASFGSEE